MEAALQVIREKMGDIDIDAEEIDAKLLDSLRITNDHFRHAMTVCNPSALRERQVHTPHLPSPPSTPPIYHQLPHHLPSTLQPAASDPLTPGLCHRWRSRT
jgi:hypothetical protein